MKLFSKKQVCQSTVQAKAWNFTRGGYIATIITTIYEKKLLFYRWFEIDQLVPLMEQPFYDGEYNANENMRNAASHERKLAQLWINNGRTNTIGLHNHPVTEEREKIDSHLVLVDARFRVFFSQIWGYWDPNHILVLKSEYQNLKNQQI